MQYSQILIAASIIILLIVIYYYISYTEPDTVEKFAPFIQREQTNCDCDFTKKYDFTSDADNVMFNGNVFRLPAGDKKYRYLFKFNLPIPYGGDYNQQDGKYVVYVSSNTQQSLIKLGHLNRTMNGWFYLEHLTPDIFDSVKITLESEALPPKIIFEKDLD